MSAQRRGVAGFQREGDVEERANNRGQEEAGEEIEVVPEVVSTGDPTDPGYVEIEEPGEGHQPNTSRPSRAMVIVIWALILGVLGLAVLTIVLAVLAK